MSKKTKSKRSPAAKSQPEVAVAGVEFLRYEELPPKSIKPSRWNGSRCADPDLVASVKAQGVLLTTVGRELGDGSIEMVAGSRRLDAAQRAGVLVPMRIFRMSDEQARDCRLIENLQREDLPLLDEAADVAGMLAEGRTPKEIGASLGKHWTWVVRRAALGNLAPKLVKALETPDHAAQGATVEALELLAKYPHEVQESIIENEGRERWFWEDTGRLRDRLANRTHHLRLAPWSKQDALLCPASGACAECKKRSGYQPGLFDDVEDPAQLAANDMCLDGNCWQAKAAANLSRAEAAARAEHPDLIKVCTEHPDYGSEAQKDGSVLKPYQFDKAKKSAEGARPALVVFGPGEGKVIWVTVDDREDAVRAAGGGEDDGGGKEQPLTLEQKREALEKRRVALIVEQKLKPELQASKLPRPDGDVLNATGSVFYLRLVAAFGATAPTMVFEDTECGWPAFEGSAQTEANLLHEQVWQLVKGKLAEQLQIFKAANIDPEFVGLAQKTAALLGLKWVELLAWAVQELPEPKSWAKAEKI